MTQDPYSKNPKQTLLWAGGGALIFIVGILAFGAGSGWFGLAGSRASNLEKPGDSGPSALAKPAEAAPMLPKPGEASPMLPKQAVRMPQDVYDWLKHLEECERRRRKLSMDQIGALTVQMTYMSLGAGKKALEGLLTGDPDALENHGPAEEMAASAQKMRGEWRALNEYFKSYPPPQECVGAFSSYGELLGETSSMILEVMDAIAAAKENPENAIAALNSLKGDSNSRIGRPGLETDRHVQEICDRYETRKWFSIASDFGQGSLGQAGGLPNMGTGN
jgi:hypothetical protein